MRWIYANDLKKWDPDRDCQEHLPLVIRRLILATVKDLFHISFPAGDSVGYSGWDGMLNASESAEYFPDGLSVWEIGTGEDTKGKAERDYQKRKSNPLGLNPSETTIIFVTRRIWENENKAQWCKEKKSENFWKDVKAYDARDLEEWLEQTPAVGAWLARHIGKYPENVKALDDWWQEWSTITNPNLTSKLVLSGRESQAELIRNWLNSSPSSTVIQAATTDEAIAFLAAVINTLSESEQEFYLSRSLIVENKKDFDRITVTSRNNLLLIPQFDDIEKTPLAVQKGHHVYVPLAPDNTITTEKIVLHRLDRDAFVSAVIEMGISDEDAQKYSKDTGRSLTVMRRQMKGLNNQPEWAKENYIIPAMLAGRWLESNDADKEIVSQLAGESYQSFSKKLSIWLCKPDSPILKIGELWRMVSPIDAWFALAHFLTNDDLQKFKEIFLKVFKTIDPALDLEPEKRWMSAVYGKIPIYSWSLMKGIAQTLILMAVFGDDTKLRVSTTAQTWVDNIIRELFQNSDDKLWCSLAGALPLIAEASPLSFLEAVDSSLNQNNPPIMSMFSETKDAMTSSSQHCHLLWALECLAWSPKLIGRVTLILGKLARLDPGGKLLNRPVNSLRTIFLLCQPHTFASLEKRLYEIDLLIEREPEIGWNLLTDIMPRSHDCCSPTPKPRWRQFSDKTEDKVTIPEYFQSVRAIIDRLLQYVGNDVQRWLKMLEHFSSSLPAEERDKIIEHLFSCENEIKNPYEIWNKLRKILSHHRSCPDAEWSFKEQELAKIEKAYLLLEPKDSIERFRWLFDSDWIDLPEGKDDYKENHKILMQHRSEAIKAIKTEHGLDGLIKLAVQIDNSWVITAALNEADITQEEEQKLLSLLDDDDKKRVVFVQNYLRRQSIDKGKEWIKNLVEKARSQQWQAIKIVNLFEAFPRERFVWNFLESFNEEIRNGYWNNFDLHYFNVSPNDKVYALKQLMSVKRYRTAIHHVAMFINLREEVPVEFIAELLKKAVTEESKENCYIDTNHIQKLFENLDKSEDITEEDLAHLEWLYLPVLARYGGLRQPKTLHKELSKNPELFAEVIKCAYKPRNEEMKEDENLPHELIQQRARLAWELFRSWKTMPGIDINGINYEKLKDWIDKARELCKKSDRKETGDSHIGKILAHSMSEEQDVWPAKAVCRIIDEIQSNEINDGFVIEIYNKRGVVMKASSEGGKQEISLSEKYNKYADKCSYPRTSALLTKIAKHYEDEAKQEDLRAEIEDLEY